jgi:hypothetical protein
MLSTLITYYIVPRTITSGVNLVRALGAGQTLNCASNLFAFLFSYGHQMTTQVELGYFAENSITPFLYAQMSRAALLKSVCFIFLGQRKSVRCDKNDLIRLNRDRMSKYSYSASYQVSKITSCTFISDLRLRTSLFIFMPLEQWPHFQPICAISRKTRHTRGGLQVDLCQKDLIVDRQCFFAF